MPNWCYNTVELHHDDVSMIDALEAELQKEKPEPLNHLRPNPAGEWDYGWSVDNWGTKWEMSVGDWERQSDNIIRINFDTAWSPPITIYEYLETEGWTVNALYHEPGLGFVGRFSDGFDDYYEYDCRDRDSVENLPQELQDFSGALDDLENYEEEQHEEYLADLERTDWFPIDIKPAYVGRYEVTTKAWAYPQYCNWDGKNWGRWDGDEIEVTQWRGLAEDPNWDPVAALNAIQLQMEE